ncbi:MAG: RHS repeat-associated core domain-containing protein [Sphingobacteriales bacterium]|nr:MAG: RHS repeat-associated core domain-containing protein [Sphingobacteriales bacterium]
MKCNTRICFTDSDDDGTAEILQQTTYYPFGLPIEELSETFDGVGNNYQYNGKELNDDFGLHWMDYGARWYNPQINRWGQVDPLAEKFYAWNGYNYTYNNPLKHTDPDGRKPWYVNEITGEAQWRDEDVTAHVDENNTRWWNEGNTIEGVDALGNYVRGNNDGTTSNELPGVEIGGSRSVRFGEKLSEYMGYDVGLEFSIGPQLGFSLGKTDVQVGGNVELLNLSLANGANGISASNIQMNVFAEGKKWIGWWI